MDEQDNRLLLQRFGNLGLAAKHVKRDWHMKVFAIMCSPIFLIVCSAAFVAKAAKFKAIR